MKPFSLIALLFVLLVKSTFSQTAIVNVHITSPLALSYVGIHDPSPPLIASLSSDTYIALNQKLAGSCTVTIPVPRFFELSFYFSSNKSPFYYVLFLSPGDNLSFNVDFGKKGNAISVTGKGSENNQPLIAPLTNSDFTEAFSRNAAPGRVIAAINKQQGLNISIFNNYVRQYKPSAAFIKSYRLNQQYFAAMTYYEFKHRNWVTVEKSPGKWQMVQDSLFKAIPLNNDGALVAYNYCRLIREFLTTETELAPQASQAHPEAFFKQWYNTGVMQGRKLFNTGGKNSFMEKIVTKYYGGKTAEYLYAMLLSDALAQKAYQNIGVVFDHFKQKFPDSRYIEVFESAIAAIESKQYLTLNSNMVFVTQNGSALNTMGDLLALTKGKTVFVDMWGTWCSPCRQEIEANSAALKAYFKSKDVLFLYIANFDVAHEQQWKKLIAFYQLEGTHILANEKLTGAIMGKIKADGYPTYFIIKKDGSYGRTKTQHPVNLQALIKEIELAM